MRRQRASSAALGIASAIFFRPAHQDYVSCVPVVLLTRLLSGATASTSDAAYTPVWRQDARISALKGGSCRKYGCFFRQIWRIGAMSPLSSRSGSRIELSSAMLRVLKERHDRHEEIQRHLTAGSVEAADIGRLSEEMGALSEAAEHWKARERLLDEIRGLREAESDEAEEEEVRAMCREDAARAEEALAEAEEQMALSLLPEDEDDTVRGVVMEVKGAVGGEEACMFAGELLDMYRLYCRNRGWRFDLVSMQKSEMGYCKHATVEIVGDGAYRELRYEAGVHRVQRVPTTIRENKIQTSAAAVLVLPEARDAQVVLDPKDLSVEVMRSGGAGGQHVNTTESAVRVTHLPSGLSVRIEDERSQHQNKEKALRVLRTRLLEMQRAKESEARGQEAAAQLAGGDRSAKIRTYNYKEGRVTDHRVGLTLYKLGDVLSGEALGELVEALVLEGRRQRIAGMATLGDGAEG